MQPWRLRGSARLCVSVRRQVRTGSECRGSVEVHDIRTVQEMLGHKDVKTLMICPHVLNGVPAGVHRPVVAA